MPGAETRYLLGPGLLLGLCAHRPNAVAWADGVAVRHCFISSLALALVQSVIDSDAADAGQREEWLQALAQLRNRHLIDGGTVVDVTADVVAKWRHWRNRSPLQFAATDGPQEIEQDVRLLLATADALGLTYVDDAAPYLEQAARHRLAVHAIPPER